MNQNELVSPEEQLSSGSIHQHIYSAEQYHHQNYIPLDRDQIRAYEDARTTRLLFEAHKVVEMVRFQILTISSVFIFMSYDETYFDEHDTQIYWIISSLTAVLILLTYLTYSTKLNYQKAALLVPQHLGIHKSKFLRPLIFECMILLAHPNYWARNQTIEFVSLRGSALHYYTLNEIFTLLSLLRGYIVLRIFMHFSPYYNSQTQRLCQVYGAPFNDWFIAKTLLLEHPFHMVTIAFVWAIVYFIQAVLIVEYPDNREQSAHSMFESAMNVVLFSMQVSEANVYDQKTTMGRLVGAIIMWYGFMLISVFMTAIIQAIALNEEEYFVSILLEKLKLKSQIQKTSNLVNIQTQSSLRYMHNPFSIIRVTKTKALLLHLGNLKRKHKSLDGETLTHLWGRSIRFFRRINEELLTTYEEYFRQQAMIREYLQTRAMALKYKYM